MNMVEICISCIAIFVIVIFIVIKKRADIETQNQNILKDAEIENQIYKELIKNHYSNRKINHELQKQKSILLKLQDDASVEDVILEIVKNRKEKMKKLGITYEEELQSINNLHITKMHSLSLFLNLFDNAIESCMKVEKNRKISFDIHNVGGMIQIVMMNSKPVDLSPIVQGFQSTKEDSDAHGIGMGVIREVVDSYNGKIEYEDKGECFLVKITLPV